MNYGSDVMKGLKKSALRKLYAEFRAATMARTDKFESTAVFDKHMREFVRPQNGGIVAARDFVMAAAGQLALTYTTQVGTTSAICGQAPLYSTRSSAPHIAEIYRRHGVTIPTA